MTACRTMWRGIRSAPSAFLNRAELVVLAHKIREALADEKKDETVSGEVEIDGAYFGVYVKPANWTENRRDRRLVENQSGKRRVVVIMRERNGITLPFVFRSEAQSISTIASRVEGKATIYADEARHWDILHDRFLTKRINHEENRHPSPYQPALPRRLRLRNSLA